jgi:hypothetical protein
MTTAEKNDLVARLQAGKRKAKAERPARLAAVEAAMDQEGAAYKDARVDGNLAGMKAARERIRGLGVKRSRLQAAMEGDNR